jgi:hypothetical protein
LQTTSSNGGRLAWDASTDPTLPPDAYEPLFTDAEIGRDYPHTPTVEPTYLPDPEKCVPPSSSSSSFDSLGLSCASCQHCRNTLMISKR